MMLKMLKCWLWGSLFLCLLFGCEKSKVVLDQKQFTSILIDMHMADAIISQTRTLNAEGEKKTYAYYNAIYNKYGIDKETFDSCMYYYSSQTELFSKIYDVVIDSLNKRLTEKTRVLSVLRARDSVNYFPDTDTIILDTAQMVYVAEIDSIGPGLYKFSTIIKFDTIDKGNNNMIKSYFVSADMKDTLHVRDINVFSDTLQHLYHWSQYVDSSYNRLIISFVEAENIRKLKYRQGKAWGTALFKPYVSFNTEKRIKPMLPLQNK